MLGTLQRKTPGKWVWLHCTSSAYWGPNEPSDTLRRCARCSKCGHKGATAVGPSYLDALSGYAPFPHEMMSAAWRSGGRRVPA
jgi:hypothetical protein